MFNVVLLFQAFEFPVFGIDSSYSLFFCVGILFPLLPTSANILLFFFIVHLPSC